MSHNVKTILAASTLMLLGSCAQQNKENKMGTYGYDTDFFTKNNIEFLELTGKDGLSKLLIAPGYQGRVMTSTADGDGGDSYGWINYKLIESGKVDKQFNPVGGEERFWLGPEGGKFSYYFKDGEEQVYENWVVPTVIDTERYDIASQDETSVKFTKDAVLTNASGTVFNIGIERTISLLTKDTISTLLGVSIPNDMKFIAYQTNNVIKNNGEQAWTKETGVPSIWLLGMFNPTPTTTVFIPYETEAEGVIVNDEYFGKVPTERLIPENGMLYFQIDGKYRAKIGIPASRAKDLCGSYDSQKKVLTLVWYTLPEGDVSYVNGQWGEQKDAFNGDVINAYNDGPVADGSIMGPFYEIETSSPGAELKPTESQAHIQRVIHLQGEEAQIANIVQTLFGVELSQISTRFQ